MPRIRQPSCAIHRIIFSLAKLCPGFSHIICLLCIAVLSINSGAALYAQAEIAGIHHFGKAEGLDLPQVTSIFQDESGLLWFLNQESSSLFSDNASQIVRFDGRTFRTMYHPDQLELKISQICRLDTHQLLINYNQPFYDVFDIATGHSRRMNFDDFYSNEVSIWGTRNTAVQQVLGIKGPEKIGLIAWNGEQLDTLSSFPFQQSRYEFKGVFQQEDTIWLSHAGIGLIKYNRATRQWKQYTVQDLDGIEAAVDKDLPLTIADVATAANGDLIFSMRGQFPRYFRYQAAKDKFFALSGLPDDQEAYLPYQDEAGHVLLSFGDVTFCNGIWLLDVDGRVIDYSHLLQSIESNTYYFFSEDFTDHLWVGTTAGLVYLKLRSNERKVHPMLLPYSMRNAIDIAPGKSLFTTELNGWFLWEETRDTLLPFALFQGDNPQSANYCRGLFLDDDGWLWASNHLGILKVNVATRQCEFFESSIGIQAFTQLQNGHFLLAGRHPTLVEFDPETKAFSDYIPIAEDHSLLNKFCHSLHQATDGVVWAGTDAGLIRFDKAAQSIRLYDRKDGFKSKVILTIHEASDGKLWLGTGGAGVHIFDPETEQHSFLQEKDGLVSSIVAGILEDSQGDMWFSTFNGLSCYRPEDETFLNFDTLSGFSHYEFNRHSFYRKSDGRLCFGTVKGMNLFDPFALKGGQSAPNLRLSEAQFYDRKENKQKIKLLNLSELTTVQLPAHDRYLRLRLALSEPADAHLHKYAYFLEGFDEAWNPLTSSNEIIFNRLPAGHYTLHLRGVNAQGVRNINPLKINIRIAEYFYKTGWFIALIILVFMGGLYALYRYRLNQIYKMMELRTRLASDLHDDVGGLLTGIAMQTEMLELGSGQPSKNKLHHLRELSTNALSRMRDIVWSVDARRDKIGDLLDRMREQADEMLTPKGIEYRIRVYDLNEEKVLPIQARQHLYLIFKEALSNAIRHAQATRLEIHIGNRNGHFELRILDNGIGLDVNKKATGLGLENIKRRAAMIDATIEFINDEGLEIRLKRGPI